MASQVLGRAEKRMQGPAGDHRGPARDFSGRINVGDGIKGVWPMVILVELARSAG